MAFLSRILSVSLILKRCVVSHRKQAYKKSVSKFDNVSKVVQEAHGRAEAKMVKEACTFQIGWVQYNHLHPHSQHN